MWGSPRAEARPCQTQQGLIHVLLYEKGGFHSVLGFTPLILRWLLHVQEEGAAGTLVLQFQERLRALALILGQFAKKVTHTLQSHIFVVEIEAQREVGVGGPQLHVNQAGGIILTNLGAHDWSVIRSLKMVAGPGDRGQLSC